MAPQPALFQIPATKKLMPRIGMRWQCGQGRVVGTLFMATPDVRQDDRFQVDQLCLRMFRQPTIGSCHTSRKCFELGWRKQPWRLRHLRQEVNVLQHVGASVVFVSFQSQRDALGMRITITFRIIGAEQISHHQNRAVERSRAPAPSSGYPSRTPPHHRGTRTRYVPCRHDPFERDLPVEYPFGGNAQANIRFRPPSSVHP